MQASVLLYTSGKFQKFMMFLPKYLSVQHYSKYFPYSAGVWVDRLWPDDWAAVTADGKRSAQFEHTLLVSSIPFEFWSCSFEINPFV